MNKMSLPLAAALMMSVSFVPSYAQDKERGDAPSMKTDQDRGPPASKSDRGEMKPTQPASKDSGAKSENSEAPRGNKSAEDGGRADRPARTPAAERKDDNEKSKSESSAAKEDKNRKDEAAESKSKADKSKSAKDDKNDASKSAREDSKPKSDDGRSEQSRDAKSKDAPRTAEGQKSGDRAKPDKVKTADLSGDKKTRVKSSFKSENIKRETNVSIDISVGRRVPRDWDYRPVPVAVIDIVPEYRGYSYAYVDDRYVIVDPETYEVVYVIDDEGGSAAVGASSGDAGRSRCSGELTFSQEDRRFILERAHGSSSAEIRIGDLRVGVDLPKDAQVKEFPSEVTSRVNNLGNCRYFVSEERVIIVDPDHDRVVAIVE